MPYPVVPLVQWALPMASLALPLVSLVPLFYHCFANGTDDHSNCTNGFTSGANVFTIGTIGPLAANIVQGSMDAAGNRWYHW